MAEETKIAQKKADTAFQRITRLPIVDRALDAARRGLQAPDRLTEDETRLVCRTLIFQYAQMGIE